MSNTSTVPSPGSKILLTGASGFLAIHVAQALLADGFEVIGTVRSTDKGEWLKKNVLKDDKFSFVIVEDVMADGAFDDHVKGVEGIVHTASPFHMEAKSPSELIEPAVKGTLGVFHAAHKHGKDVKRIVITSSVAAVENADQAGPFTRTDDDWDTYSPKQCEEKGDKASGVDMYYASKTLAERAAHEFIAKEKPSFSFAAINPPYIFGPILQDVKSASSINTSVGLFFPVVKGETSDPKELAKEQGNWVDVRDVAYAHAKALSLPEAGGQRFIVSNGPFCLQEFTDALLSLDPSSSIPKGNPGTKVDPSSARVFSGKKAEKVLGVKYTPLKETAKAMEETIRGKGFL